MGDPSTSKDDLAIIINWLHPHIKAEVFEDKEFTMKRSSMEKKCHNKIQLNMYGSVHLQLHADPRNGLVANS